MLSIKIINQEICIVQVMNFLQILTFCDCKNIGSWVEIAADAGR